LCLLLRQQCLILPLSSYLLSNLRSCEHIPRRSRCSCAATALANHPSTCGQTLCSAPARADPITLQRALPRRQGKRRTCRPH
jgi:hypothetical protein